MRPVVKGDDPPYTAKVTFTFGEPVLSVIRQYVTEVAPKTFSISGCLEFWTWALDQPSLTEDVIDAVQAVRNKVDDLYKKASMPLVGRIGPFCSYCESPLSGLAEVEHCAPKSQYPMFSTSWENFLLACGPCNTAKSNNPSRSEAAYWSGLTSPTEEDLYKTIREILYVWPDLTPESYSALTYTLKYNNGKGWIPLDMGMATDLDNAIELCDMASRVIMAVIPQLSSQSVPIAVKVDSNLNGHYPDPAQGMIDLCRLNDCSNAESSYDRRAMNRTLAWFTCLKSLANISAIGDEDVRRFLWSQLYMTASATGFFSVWLTIINFICGEDSAREFINQTNASPWGGFPGTNPELVL